MQWDRNCNGFLYFRMQRRSFSQIFENQIASHTEPHQINLIILQGSMLDDRRKIISGTRVIKKRLFVYFTTTSAKVPCEHIIMFTVELSCHAFYIGSLAIAFQSVTDYYQFF